MKYLVVPLHRFGCTLFLYSQDELDCMQKCQDQGTNCKTFVFRTDTQSCYLSSWLRPRHNEDINSDVEEKIVSGTRCPVPPVGFCHFDWGFIGNWEWAAKDKIVGSVASPLECAKKCADRSGCNSFVWRSKENEKECRFYKEHRSIRNLKNTPARHVEKKSFCILCTSTS